MALSIVLLQGMLSEDPATLDISQDQSNLNVPFLGLFIFFNGAGWLLLQKEVSV